MATNDLSAARALLAHYNSRLASRLARHVLKEAGTEPAKRLAAAIMALIPKAVEQTLWQQVLKLASTKGAAYLDTPGFLAKVQRAVESNADNWLHQAGEHAVRERAAAMVKSVVGSFPMKGFIDSIPGRFQAAVEAEITRLAKEKVAVAAQVPGPSGV